MKQQNASNQISNSLQNDVTRGKGTFYGISAYNWSPNPGKKIFLYGYPLDVNNYNRNKIWHQYNFGYTIFKINKNLVLDYWWILGDY